MLNTKYKPPMTCDFFDSTAESESQDTLTQLSLTEFLGPFLLMATGAFAALCAYFYFRKSQKDKKEESKPTPQEEIRGISKEMADLVKRLQQFTNTDLDAGGFPRSDTPKAFEMKEISTRQAQTAKVRVKDKWVDAALFPTYNATILDTREARKVDAVGYQMYDVRDSKIQFETAVGGTSIYNAGVGGEEFTQLKDGEDKIE